MLLQSLANGVEPGLACKKGDVGKCSAQLTAQFIPSVNQEDNSPRRSRGPLCSKRRSKWASEVSPFEGARRAPNMHYICFPYTGGRRDFLYIARLRTMLGAGRVG